MPFSGPQRRVRGMLQRSVGAAWTAPIGVPACTRASARAADARSFGNEWKSNRFVGRRGYCDAANTTPFNVSAVQSVSKKSGEMHGDTNGPGWPLPVARPAAAGERVFLSDLSCFGFNDTRPLCHSRRMLGMTENFFYIFS